VIGLAPSERSELRRLVGRLSARPADAAQRTTADGREVRRVVELLGRAGRYQRAHTISGGARRSGTLRRINILLINRNDRRVVKLRVWRWPAVVAILGTILLTVTSGTISRDYARLRHQRATLAALDEKVVSNEALLDHYGARVREISDEIESWRLARSVEPLRRDSGPARPEIGLAEEITRLLGVVEEEGDRLRSLEQFVGENGRMLASLPSSWPVRGPLNSDFGPRRSPFARSQRVSSPRDPATRHTSQSPHDADPIPAR
jgi:hypothetical protein